MFGGHVVAMRSPETIPRSGVRTVVAGIVLTALSACTYDDVSRVGRPDVSRSGLNFGYAVSSSWLANTDYAEIVRRDATIVTPENAMKWDHIHPEPDVYDFSGADEIVAQARANGQTVRGHTLVWHQQLPSWLEDGDWSRDDLIDVLRDHITTVIGHYRDRFPGVVTQWDVVNEAFTSQGLRRDSLWQRVIGDDYIELAFRFAREADPAALLFYNDYYDDSMLGAPGRGGDGPTADGRCDVVPKCVATRNLADRFVRAGVPIDGIGFEGHVFDGRPVDYQAFSSWTLELGLQWALTEVDGPLAASDGSDPAALEAQAAMYESMVDDCLTSPNCDTVVVWGVTDSQSWVTQHTHGALGHAVLYTADFEPKPAAERVLSAIHRAHSTAGALDLGARTRSPTPRDG